MRGAGARFVYILKSDVNPDRHYVGRTSDVDNRLAWHNEGPSGYTTEHRPWSVIVSLEFPDESHAARFEKYLKSGIRSGFGQAALLKGRPPATLFGVLVTVCVVAQT